MTDLLVRSIPFEFEGVDFVWNSRNPEFALLANVLSFQTIGFEGFIGKSMMAVRGKIDEPALLAELNAFRAQEMTHSKAHRAHVQSMIDRYPGLQAVYDDCIADFNEKWRQSSEEYRLAYSAIIEASSLPLYRVVIDNRKILLAGSNTKVASLLLWHFCEELEHRGSAFDVYEHIVGKRLYRMKVFPDVGKHLSRNMHQVLQGIMMHVPEARGLDIRRAMARLPRTARLKLVSGLFYSQLPFYNPSNGSIPDFCHEWAMRYSEGQDMRYLEIA